MPTDVFVIVLLASLIHAAWNALVKADGDRLTLIKTMSVTQFALSACLVPFVSIPANAAWPYLLTSAFVTVGYILFLSQAYRHGDLSHAYPLARGFAPLIVATVMLSLGEQLNHTSQIAILFIGLGITSLSLTRGKEGLRDLRMVGFALGASGFIAAYTVLDGFGARTSGTVHGYMVWVSLISSILIAAAVHLLRGQHRTLTSHTTVVTGIVAGLTSYMSSWMVIWALTKAPIPLVSALRETSIVFAVAIGVVFLKEQLNVARLASIAATLIGTTILKISR
jgi:drug/metabolite transporter (DMT)-like permease